MNKIVISQKEDDFIYFFSQNKTKPSGLYHYRKLSTFSIKFCHFFLFSHFETKLCTYFLRPLVIGLQFFRKTKHI